MAPLPAKLKAVIFDLDDTLVFSTVDYSKFKRQVIERIASHGEDGSLYSPDETVVRIISRYEAHMKSKGLPAEEIRSRLSELDRIMDKVELERVGETEAIPGAAKLLETLRSKGVKIGILTRGCREYASHALARAGLLELVDEVECRNSHSKPKPDPESYLRLVRALGVRKEETLFVGDHPIDAQCALNAGVGFIAVESGDVPKERFEEMECLGVFKDVGQLVEWFEKNLHF